MKFMYGSSLSRFDCGLPFVMLENLDAADPFEDSAAADDSGAGTKNYVHVRVQQRNGRKSLTTVQGLNKNYNYNKILKDFKKVCTRIYLPPLLSFCNTLLPDGDSMSDR